jgi:hypothetical protein
MYSRVSALDRAGIQFSFDARRADAAISMAITLDMASSREGREGAILSKCCCTPR